MTFDEMLAQVQALLQQEKRVSYRGLKRRFALDDEYLEDLKEELIHAKQVAVDEEGKVLVWAGAGINGEKDKGGNGEGGLESSVQSLASEGQGRTPTVQTLDSRRQTLDVAAERRQLTVMFCDLVGSTRLSEQLDPEEYRTVVQAYQETSTGVIRCYDGHIAQHLGDGLLVYFGYPLAHEDDATRAVRAGLEIVEAIRGQVTGDRLERGQQPLQVRIGIHTGLVVIGEIGSSNKREVLALGETPNVAARLQGLAEPDTVVLSAVTQRLVAGLFECRDLGPQTLKGISTPLSVYQVIGETTAQSRFDVAVWKGLTPLVGREEELGLLRRRWEQAKGGAGQVVFLSGEPGIGKSRLVQALTEHVLTDGATRIEFRCSAYHQNSAFYPAIEYLQRILQFTRDDSAEQKLEKLEQLLSHSRLDLQKTVPLLASLLSLPAPRYTLPAFSPQKQKQKTQEVLVAWIIEETEKAAVYCAWEDLHWADPSTLEVLTLFLEQVPTARLLATLTFRPEFTPPWKSRSHISHLTLSRLGQLQVEAMVEQVTGDNLLPKEIVQQIVSKTDGVPLFVEELTKSVLESVGVHDSALLQSLAIPSTLHDSLMARLDRLGAAKEIAQLGATIGREFSYELLHAVSLIDEEELQHGLKQIVEAELVYQRGLVPQASYLFKHALIQDTAYQSLLKSKRQQYHQQIAKMLEEQFPQTVETQPELLAHHYTEAGLTEQAITYWQRAGEKALKRSANIEAISHLTKGLELLKTLPDTPERTQQELTLQIALGEPLRSIKGEGAPEVAKVYTRALELCRQVGETPQLFPAMVGLWLFYLVRGELQSARELVEQLLRLAQNVQDPALLLPAHLDSGMTLYVLGEFASAREHLEQGIAFYDPQQYRSQAFHAGHDPGVGCLSYLSWVLWFLGYPDQALKRSQEALTLAQEMSRPFSVAFALNWAAMLHQFRREAKLTQERAEAAIVLATEQRFPDWIAMGSILRGWALVEQGQMQQGLAAFRVTGTKVGRPHFLALLAEAYGKVGQGEEGLPVLTEAMAATNKTGERYYEAEIYRLRGELTLAQSSVQGLESSVQANQKSKRKSQKSKIETSPQPLTPSTQAEAEGYFLKAIEIARRQQAKSLELRAVMSLVRLRQRQAMQAASRNTQHESRSMLNEARNMLAEIYGWFTEGLDTKDLQEAKALLDELS